MTRTDEFEAGQRSPLTPEHLKMLAFEAKYPKHDGIKEERIARGEVKGDGKYMSPNHYYQHLNHIIDHPEAEERYPLMVHRMRRIREVRRKSRSAKELGLNI